MAKFWYIVHTYSGFEHKVKAALQERIRLTANEDLIDQILVPTEKVVELVKGKRKTSSRKFYPGYIVVHMELNDETWHLVRHTPKVTG
ncbi:MAG TPA: transcription termination/antitermination protein NusG, partial [Syntrophobacteraceae bacterium]|nr:transcription termination/antitermination protein NusG [Syntrophobacteraceae bacterium]